MLARLLLIEPSVIDAVFVLLRRDMMALVYHHAGS